MNFKDTNGKQEGCDVLRNKCQISYNAVVIYLHNYV